VGLYKEGEVKWQVQQEDDEEEWVSRLLKNQRLKHQRSKPQRSKPQKQSQPSPLDGEEHQQARSDMKNSFNKFWKSYILNEGASPDIGVWIQSLAENLSLLKPQSVKESKRVEAMRHQLSEIRRCTRRMQKEMKILQEENKLLQEKKSDDKRKES
tara:strand:- start:64 stop:528 length:465 start_codon:yes stop_codon:yes gene_type:complete